MREAIGSSLLFNLVITFVIVMIAFLISSLAYSKAFKVKNRIINIIEKNEGFDNSLSSEINNELSNMGYRVSKNHNCKKIDNIELVSTGNSYEYCIYEKKTTNGSYYKVVTYMYFDIPIIGSLLHFPVSGETKVFYDTYINYE